MSDCLTAPVSWSSRNKSVCSCKWDDCCGSPWNKMRPAGDAEAEIKTCCLVELRLVSLKNKKNWTCWKFREGGAAGWTSLISMDAVLTLPRVFFCFFFFLPAFWWCFILNHSIKLTRNLPFGFGSLSHSSVIAPPQLVCVISLFPWEPVWMG